MSKLQPRLSLVLLAIISGLSGLVYLGGVQILRHTADTRSIQLSEDTARAMEQGAKTGGIVPRSYVDMRKGLAPFVIIYNNHGKVLASSAKLDGQPPVPPKSEFDYAGDHHQNRFTWEPAPAVRIAAIMTRFDGGGQQGFALVGSSLRETQKQIDGLRHIAATVWLMLVVILLIASTAPPRRKL